LKVLPLAGLLTRLRSSFGWELLAGGALDTPGRQQTLRQAIEWSYGLLRPVEQQTFCWLSVFQEGARLEAIETVFAKARRDTDDEALHSPDAILETVCILVENSLVLRDASVESDTELESEPRFRLLNTVHGFAQSALSGRPEAEQVRAAHAAYFSALLEDAGANGNARSEEETALLEREYANIMAALAYWIKQQEAERALRLAVGLWKFWQLRGFLEQGRQLLGSALELAARGLWTPGSSAPEKREKLAQSPQTGALYARALNASGALALSQGDYEAARAAFSEALEIRRHLGDPIDIAASLNNLSLAARYLGDFETASSGLEESLQIQHAHGREQIAARVQNNLGNLLREKGEPEAALTQFTQSLNVLRQHGDKIGMAAVLNNLGVLARETGDLPRARQLRENSLGLERALGNRQGIALSMHELALVAIAAGQNSEAAIFLAEALWVWRDLQDVSGQILAVEGFARLAAAQAQENAHETTRALQLALIADASRTSYHVPRSPHEENAWCNFITACRARLSDAESDALYLETAFTSLANTVSKLLKSE
jgi:non-specific serine/threonine protein kinase